MHESWNLFNCITRLTTRACQPGAGTGGAERVSTEQCLQRQSQAWRCSPAVALRVLVCHNSTAPAVSVILLSRHSINSCLHWIGLSWIPCSPSNFLITIWLPMNFSLGAENVLISWHRLSSLVYISIFARNDEVSWYYDPCICPLRLVGMMDSYRCYPTSFSPSPFQSVNLFLFSYLSLRHAVLCFWASWPPSPAPGGPWPSHANHHIWPPPQWLIQMLACDLNPSTLNKIQESSLGNWGTDRGDLILDDEEASMQLLDAAGSQVATNDGQFSVSLWQGCSVRWLGQTPAEMLPWRYFLDAINI